MPDDEVSEEGDDDELPLSYLTEDSWANMSITWKMDRLRTVKVTGPKFKLLVDQEDILTDAVALYKSPSFDPTRPLRVTFENQLAIDSGGVLWEIFLLLKKSLSVEGFSKCLKVHVNDYSTIMSNRAVQPRFQKFLGS